jgi:hypothetical protein
MPDVPLEIARIIAADALQRATHATHSAVEGDLTYLGRARAEISICLEWITFATAPALWFAAYELQAELYDVLDIDVW